ncbi:MAG TPA: permease prefix domain 1-containing protein [Microbacteriaceae bacterium]|nr:permease prefix domain 1-containing protein [Microbacteriaceae bacterium]
MTGAALEARIAEWRGYVDRARAIDTAEAEELESHLRERIDELRDAGLDDDEAFLVAVGRLGAIDAISREFARTNSARLWKQLVAGAEPVERTRGSGIVSALLIGVVAAAVLQLIRLLSIGTLADDPTTTLFGRPADPTWLLRNAGLIPVAAVAAWLLVRRRPGLPIVLATVVPFVLVALAINLMPLAAPDAAGGLLSQSLLLTALHAPIACWLLVGLADTATGWRSTARRMDLVRFTGEGFVYYVLIALGGQLLFALTAAILAPLARDAVAPLAEWGLLSLAVIAFPFAAWLVELKQSVIENIAPVLARTFTPLFAIVTVAGAAVYLALGATQPFNRELMIVFDAILVLALGLLLYNLSARSEGRATRFFDIAGLIGVIGALGLDAFVLADLVGRIGEYGWTPNRVAATGLNLLLFAVLAVAAVLSALHLAGRRPIAALERWLMGTLPAYSLWAAFVALVLPPLFGFV